MQATQPTPESIIMQLTNVRDLYSELLMLMMASADEDPMAPGSGRLAAPIGQLMETAGESLHRLRQEVAQARAGNGLPEPLVGEVIAFEDRLREGLTLMQGRLTARMNEIRQQQESVKQEIGRARAKRRGAKGYRGGLSRSRIMESDI